MSRPFHDRASAGRRLAESLRPYAGRADVLVLGLPRGGVIVAAEVAEALNVELDVMLVRKLGVPSHEELAMGAVGPGQTRVVNREVVAALHISADILEAVARREQAELARRQTLYRGNRPLPRITGRTVLVVDDGLATGATMRAAVAAIRQLEPARTIVAVPLGATAAVRELAREADEVVCLLAPDDFDGVSQWYDDFSQTSDEEVCQSLRSAWARPEVSR